MKKYNNPIPDGGAPLNNNRLNTELNLEFWDTIEGLMSRFLSDSEGVILTGCVITGGGPYNISAGIVFLNGEFMRLPAQTGVTLPTYIQPDAVNNITKQFADGANKTLIIEKAAKIGAAPGSGQKISIITTTDPDDRRFNVGLNQDIQSEITLRNAQNPGGLITKVVNIGDWNMDSTATIAVPHGLADFKKIRSFQVIVRDDADTFYSDLLSQTTQSAYHKPSGYSNGVDSTNINLGRVASPDGDGHLGWFDGTGYDSTGYNRGWIVIHYAP